MSNNDNDDDMVENIALLFHVHAALNQHTGKTETENVAVTTVIFKCRQHSAVVVS